jgi:hypothetical protein
LKGTWLADLLDMTNSAGNFFFGPAAGGKLPAASAPVKGTFSEIPAEAEVKLSKKVDAYLYLGPRDLLLNEPAPVNIVLDMDYMGELQRRASITKAGPMADQVNPQKISERDANPFFYDPDEFRNLMQSPGPPSSSSGNGN